VATAWQRAMRGKRPRTAWSVTASSRLRADTYQVEIDSADGVFTARLYPDGRIDSNRRLTETEAAKVRKALEAAKARLSA
jgi:hypothetical protein